MVVPVWSVKPPVSAPTGAITVPFMLALTAGVSAMKKGSKLSEADSFELVGILSNIINKTKDCTKGCIFRCSLFNIAFV